MAVFTFSQHLREEGIAASMGVIGDRYEDAVAESFFATLNGELLHRRPWQDW